MSKLKIITQDKSKAILTDTLPYEVPIIFGNDGYHARIAEGNYSALTSKLLHFKPGLESKPYLFAIRKDKYSNRTLAVPHPGVQADISDFYERNEQLLISLCSRSSFSLRHPSKVATRFFEKDYRAPELPCENGVEAVCEGEIGQSEFASSYFVYSNYNFLHKFLESQEFHDLEKRFFALTTCDISKCFPSIYTHTISWAVKSKEYAKNHKKVRSFESEIDKLMSRTNDLETHGIIVGPEFSRIFAEVILQKIDVEIETVLREQGYVHNEDYAIRRYVDDYFIFTNDNKMSDIVVNALGSKLEFFKLYLNNSKTVVKSRPFSSAISNAKLEISLFLNKLFKITWGNLIRKSLSESTEADLQEHHYAFKKSPSSNKSIARYKAIINSSGVDVTSVSRYTLSIAHKKLFRYYRKVGGLPKSASVIDSFLAVTMGFLDYVFFVYSLDINVRTTYTLSRIIFLVCNLAKLFSDDVTVEISKRMFDEIRQILSYSKRGTLPKPIELANLLLSLKALRYDGLVSVDDIVCALQLDKHCGQGAAHFIDIDYFSLVTFLAVADSDTRFDHVRCKLLDCALRRFDSTDNVHASCELTCMFFDLISCPSVDLAYKQRLVNIVLSKYSSSAVVTASQVQSEIDFISPKTWFSDWNVTSHIDNAFHKKELRTPY